MVPTLPESPGASPSAALPAGSRVGKFRVVSELGRGGMGIVYRAQDEQLQRAVALKVLPAERVGDESARRRLLREARAAAAVTHPAIATVYEVGEHEGIVFIALELVEGRTLRASMRGRPLPVELVVRVGTQIAQGLARAHAKGVVHRDLKPDNVMVTDDGHVKVLDFGIAKAMVAPGAAADGARATRGTTQQGLLLGTPAYMAPEQAHGAGDVDGRADLFSLGAVLYEALTAQRPFARETVLATVLAVLQDEPAPPSTRNAAVPKALDRVVLRCLRKNREERYASAAELIAELYAVASGAAGTTPDRVGTAPLAAGPQPPSVRPLLPVPRRRWPLLAGLAGLATAGLAIAAAAGWRPWERPAETDSGRPTVVSRPVATPVYEERRITSFPPNVSLYGTAISPDGERIAIASSEGLVLRELRSGEERRYPVPPRTTVYSVRWSADGARLHTVEDIDEVSTFWSISVLTGDRHRLATIDNGADLSPDEQRVVHGHRRPDGRWELVSTSPESGVGTPIPTSPATFDLVTDVHLAPGGRLVSFGYRDGAAQMNIGLVTSEGGPVVRLVQNAAQGHGWQPDGTLIYAAYDDDPQTTRLFIEAVPIDVSTGRRRATAQRLARWVGSECVDLDVSLDGARVVVIRRESFQDVYLGTVVPGGSELTGVRRLTLDDGADRGARWSPDGSALYFDSTRNGTLDIFRQRIDSLAASLVVGGRDAERAPAPATDGSIYFLRQRGTGTARRCSIERIAREGIASERLLDVTAWGWGTDRPCEGVDLRCAAQAPVCLWMHREGSELVFSRLGDRTGDSSVVFRATLPELGRALLNEGFWDVAPNGAKLATILPIDAETQEVVLVDLATGARRGLRGRDQAGWVWQKLAWAADGQALYVTRMITREREGYAANDATLARVELDGRVGSLLRRSTPTWVGYPAASPDGRHIAWVEASGDDDLWLLERRQ